MRVVLVLVLLFCCGCGERLMRGIIVSKRSEPSRTWYQHVRCGKSFILVPRYDDPDWYVTIRGKSKSGRQIESEHAISEIEFNSMQIGQLVNFE